MCCFFLHSVRRSVVPLLKTLPTDRRSSTFDFNDANHPEGWTQANPTNSPFWLLALWLG